jgi:hypothetical protein
MHEVPQGTNDEQVNAVCQQALAFHCGDLWIFWLVLPN